MTNTNPNTKVSSEPLFFAKGDKQFPALLVVTQNGFGKSTYLGNYRKTARAASGVKNLKITPKTGKPILVKILFGNEETFVVTTKNGITIRLDPDAVPQLNRSTQGVKLIKLDANDVVVSGGVN
jgi:DNA gyrase subunit A